MAWDMKGLYQKVIKGDYPEISSWYSDDLMKVIKMCLEVNPSIRPTAQQLLWKREVVLKLKWNEGLELNMKPRDNVSLLDTIWCPAKLDLITDVLPKSNYQRPLMTRWEARRSKLSEFTELSLSRD